MHKHIELLAPAGSREALTAAVQNGADAVYMGGTRFSARRFADNFDDDALREAVEYAHLYGVKVYITLNILIKEKELHEIRPFLDLLRDLHVDGVIVQDLGVAGMIAREYPQLSLHASTQMTIHQLEGVKVLEKLGFSRVVLARELTLDEIRHISSGTELETECFIHGALCVSYSGQCLMSSMLGGRSGNRGMCAQPCRLPYTIDSCSSEGGRETAYHLSTKDLSTVDFLNEIAEAGVVSLKIEGRMKRPEYVAVVTREYRRALDALMGPGRYAADPGSYRELMQIFNRGGFTKGYYYGTDHTTLYSPDKPNNWGIYLGKTVKRDGRTVYVELREDLEVGDGIEYWVQGGEGRGQTVTALLWDGKAVDKVPKGGFAGIRTSMNISPGTKVYKTSSSRQLKAAQATYGNMYGRKMPVSARAAFKHGREPYIILCDDEGNTGQAKADSPVQAALSKPLSREDIMLHLSKLGDTPYTIVSWDLDLDDNIFFPVSALNKLRRDAAQDLTENRIRHFHQKAGENRRTAPIVFSLAKNETAGAEAAQPVHLKGYLSSLSLDPSDLDGLDTIYYMPQKYDFDLIELAGRIGRIKERGIRVGLALPPITRRDDLGLLDGLPQSFWDMFDEFQAGNIGQLDLLAARGKVEIYGGHTLNVMNTATISVLRSLGLKGVVLSPELTVDEIYDVAKGSSLHCEIIVYGRIVLMTTEFCPHARKSGSCSGCQRMDTRTLTDRMGYEFPLVKRRISRCYTEILNSVLVFMADDMDAICRIKAAAWGLKLDMLSPEEIRGIIALYKYARDNPGEKLPPHLTESAEAIKAKGFTRGHFFRGVE